MGIGSIVETGRRAVFLDRDGVINKAVVRGAKPYPPASVAELCILPGVHEALLKLRAGGFLLYVVTNQPDVARGTQTRASIERMHAFIRSLLPLDGFYVCYHDNRDGCDCRKPAPGLVLSAAREHGIDLHESYLVGDRWSDVEAGQRAGCRTAWIDCGYAEPAPRVPPDVRVVSLAEAATWILNKRRKDENHDEVSTGTQSKTLR
jgi:D-glycero-D-manno-heptose 1,7-bisphosphate phosphatase